MIQWLLRYAGDTLNLDYQVADVLFHKISDLRDKVENKEYTETEMLKELKLINTMINEIFLDKGIDPVNIV